MAVVADLRGSGGSERLFARLHDYLLRHPCDVDSTLITSTTAVERLRAAGHLETLDRTIALSLGPEPGRGAVNVLRLTSALLRSTLGHFDVIHLCLPSSVYVPYFGILSRLPLRWRPRLALTVVDCTLATSLRATPPPSTYERQVLDAHLAYARWARLDGMYSWYRNLTDEPVARQLGAALTVRAARCCFTEPERFVPSMKENLVVFAGRLSAQKRPVMFVDAVAALRDRQPRLMSKWRFAIYGTGALEHDVAARIRYHSLENVITLTHAVDMAPTFARSRLFVSTQALENFTSLAMLEAMAAGNAVIAEDVGQTREFVRDRENGLLVPVASPGAFADAFVQYLSHPEWHEPMAQTSRSLATTVHTIDNFAEDIAGFWREIAATR